MHVSVNSGNNKLIFTLDHISHCMQIQRKINLHIESWQYSEWYHKKKYHKHRYRMVIDIFAGRYVLVLYCYSMHAINTVQYTTIWLNNTDTHYDISCFKVLIFKQFLIFLLPSLIAIHCSLGINKYNKTATHSGHNQVFVFITLTKGYHEKIPVCALFKTI